MVQLRSLTFVRPHTLEWRELPQPVLQSDTDALVRPVAASVCDIDRPIIAGLSPFTGPFAIGHEAVARVVEVGDRVTTLAPGELVVVPWHVACGECGRCRRGLSAHCEAVPPQAMFGVPSGGQWGGLFDDLVRVPFAGHMLVPIPPATDPLSVVSAGDNLTLGLEIMGPHLRANPGWRVLVLGFGAVGLYQVQVAVSLGHQGVVYVDDDEQRLGLANELGAAAHAGPPSSALGRFDLVVDASFNPDWLRRSARMLEPEGTLECLGGYFHDVTLPLLAMYSSGVRFRIGRSNIRPHIPGMVHLVSSGLVDPTVVHSEVLDWDAAPDALAHSSTKPVFCRD